nr:tracheary element differentiation-related 6 [Tanacetum cinerariifolium]
MTTVVFVVLVSFGCFFFLAPTLFALCYIIKKWKCKKTTSKKEMVHVDEHLKVSENVVKGPDGRKAVSISIDDDLHIHEEEEYMKNEKSRKDLHQTLPSTSSQT